jgi:hypothetical protein
VSTGVKKYLFRFFFEFFFGWFFKVRKPIFGFRTSLFHGMIDAPKTAKKPGHPSRNWSKTKQVARRMSAEACRKEEAQERKEERKATQFKERELKKAVKLLGSDFTVCRSARSKLPAACEL